MQAHRTCARLFLLASLVVGACTEQTPPTGIAAGVNAAVTAAAGANNQKVRQWNAQCRLRHVHPAGDSDERCG